jgi:hypothetical protein
MDLLSMNILDGSDIPYLTSPRRYLIHITHPILETVVYSDSVLDKDT